MSRPRGVAAHSEQRLDLNLSARSMRSRRVHGNLSTIDEVVDEVAEMGRYASWKLVCNSVNV